MAPRMSLLGFKGRAFKTKQLSLQDFKKNLHGSVD
jgi:hypothetical protein